MVKEKEKIKNRRRNRAENIKLSLRKKIVFALACLVFIPAVLLAIFGTALRISGYGFDPDFFIRRKIHADFYLTENEKFGRRFFPPALARRPLDFILPDEKPNDVVRIFVLGGSAAMGDPEPSFGFARILEALLNESSDSRKYEVINAAMTGINSHVVLPIAEDCAEQEPDLFVALAGNNEVVGPYGAGTVFSSLSRNLGFIRFRIWLKSTRLGQLLVNLKMKTMDKNDNPESWGGMTMFLDNRIRRNDPSLRITYRHFRNNLEDARKVAEKAGAEMIFCTVPVNLRSCPPFASLHNPGLSRDALRKWKSIYEKAVDLQNNKQWDAAITEFRKALELDEEYAELHYRIAECYQKKNDYEKADSHFRKAVDYDALRFRADSVINRIIREVANSDNLVDLARIFFEKSEHGVPGDNYFYDHVHLNFSGNYIAAKSVFEKMAEMSEELNTDRVLSEAGCKKRLAFTPWDNYRVNQLMYERKKRPPFTNQPGHQQAMKAFQNKLDAMKENASSRDYVRSRQIYRSAIKDRPDDWMLRENFAVLLQNSGNPVMEAEQWRKTISLLPHHPERYAPLGQALAKDGKYEEALAACRKAIQHDPENAAAFNGAAMALAGMEKIREAIDHYKKALEIKPSYTDARYNLAQLLSRAGYDDAASVEMKKILAIDPDDAGALVSMAEDMAGRGESRKAFVYYEKALEKDPQNPALYYNAGCVLMQGGNPERAGSFFRKTIDLEKDHYGAHANLGTILAREGNPEEAEKHFRKMIRIQPDNASGYYNLGAALLQMREKSPAIKYFEKCLEIDPEHTDAMNRLAWLFATSPNPDLRNGNKALKLSEKACELTNYENPLYLDTLAASFAEAGNFSEAVNTAKKALRISESMNMEIFCKDIQSRIDLFQSSKPFRREKRKP